MSRASYPGVYRARAVDVQPNAVVVRIPEIFANSLVTITDFVSAKPTGPTLGWVMFESGNASFPVWVGESDPAALTTRLEQTGMGRAPVALAMLTGDDSFNLKGVITNDPNQVDPTAGVYDWKHFDQPPAAGTDGEYYVCDHIGTIPTTVPDIGDRNIQPDDKVMSINGHWHIVSGQTYDPSKHVITTDVEGETPNKVVKPVVGQVFINTRDSLSWMYAPVPGQALSAWTLLVPSSEVVRGQMIFVGQGPVTAKGLPPSNAQPDPAVNKPRAGDIYIDTATSTTNPDFHVLDVGTAKVPYRGRQAFYVGSGPVDPKWIKGRNFGMPLDTLPKPEGRMTPQNGDIYVDVFNGTISILDGIQP